MGETFEVLRQEVIQGDCLEILPTLADNSAQIIIADRIGSKSSRI